MNSSSVTVRQRGVGLRCRPIGQQRSCCDDQLNPPCYQSVFGAGEIDPFFGGSQIMVAYETGGQSLSHNGFARIVVPGDKAGGRFVSNIAKIEVRPDLDSATEKVS